MLCRSKWGQGISFLQSPPEHRRFEAPFCSAQPFSSGSVPVVLTLPAAEHTWGHHSLVCVSVLSWHQLGSWSSALQISCSRLGGMGLPHVSGTSKAPKIIKNASLPPPASGLFEGYCHVALTSHKEGIFNIHHSSYNIQINQRTTLNIWEFI